MGNNITWGKGWTTYYEVGYEDGNKYMKVLKTNKKARENYYNDIYNGRLNNDYELTLDKKHIGGLLKSYDELFFEALWQGYHYYDDYHIKEKEQKTIIGNEYMDGFVNA